MKSIARITRGGLGTALRIAAFACLIGPGAAMAQFPNRPITLITPYAAGGSHDLNARVFTTYIQKYLGEPMIIKLVPGEAGQKGTLEAVQAQADGYTLIFTDNFRDQLYQYTFQNPHYDTNADLISVARINYGQVGLIVRGDSPYRDWQDFEASALAHPHELKMSHSGLWAAFFVAGGQVMKDRAARRRRRYIGGVSFDARGRRRSRADQDTRDRRRRADHSGRAVVCRDRCVADHRLHAPRRHGSARNRARPA
jgi:tripartite-type tricarboxylate transporter receptor subunit TctC